MKSRDYKRQARASLKGNWGAAAFAVFIYFVIMAVILTPNIYFRISSGLTSGVTDPAALSAETIQSLFATSSITSLLSIFLVYPLAVGLVNAFKQLFRTGDDKIAGNMFSSGFKNYAHNVLGMFHMGILITLWTLLLVIPGIIKLFSYAMTPYILVDRPELSTREAIHESRRMMKGRKWSLFCLELSFIGWALLCVLTLGIGNLWLAPYIYTSQASFYQNILEEDKAAAIAAEAANSAEPEPVKLREFEASNHEDYAPKEETFE